jgi:hypothetical protein
MSHQENVQDWLEHAVHQSHPLLKTWYLQAQLEQNLREHLGRDFDWLENLGEKFSQRMPVQDATPAILSALAPRVSIPQWDG